VIYRNGVLIRPEKPFGNYDTLIIDDEGNFHILCKPEDQEFAPYVGNIMHSFMFGPALVVDGQKVEITDNKYGSGPGMGLLNNTQRQCICQMDTLSYLIITTEGPENKSDKEHGFSAPQLAQLAYDVGAKQAYNLDGGNSACLVVNGVKMNRFGKGGIREITDMIYFITAEP
jgi:exopolysaccharide biosynthesis protein